MSDLVIKDRVQIYDSLLEPNECEQLIQKVESIGFEDAYIISNGEKVFAKEIRNNQRVILDDPDLAKYLWGKVVSSLSIKVEGWSPAGLNERFRFYRYTKHQMFRMHRDFPFEREGQVSKLSLIIYLNEEFEGGQTDFREFEVSPKTGRAIAFEHNLLHEGKSILSGVKYAVRTDVMFEKNNVNIGVTSNVMTRPT